MGTVSFRDHIRWGADPPSEPTSTIVLTSPARFYVDIRLLTTAPAPAPRPCPPAAPRLPIHHLDWAIGGTSSSEDRSRPDGSSFSHSVFAHFVDSRTTHPELATDAGDMFPQPDGTTLETGRMINPATGLESDYQELWRDGQPQYLPTLPKSTVLQLHDDAQATRGLFVQLGQHAQAVLRVGSLFTADRWLWSPAAAKWERAFSVGDQAVQALDDIIPALEHQLSKGDEVKARSGTWTVTEVHA